MSGTFFGNMAVVPGDGPTGNKTDNHIPSEAKGAKLIAAADINGGKPIGLEVVEAKEAIVVNPEP